MNAIHRRPGSFVFSIQLQEEFMSAGKPISDEEPLVSPYQIKLIKVSQNLASHRIRDNVSI